jgi:hypothetical protein
MDSGTWTSRKSGSCRGLRSRKNAYSGDIEAGEDAPAVLDHVPRNNCQAPAGSQLDSPLAAC